MSGSYLRLLREADRLYQGVVTAPGSWSDDALEEWGVEAVTSGEPPSRDVARELRRCLRIARKLREFWLSPPEGLPSDAGDWRTRVDMALGIRAWRPLLAIAQAGLREDAGAELYEETKRRFREVHSVPWMEGVTYAEWRAGAAPQA